MTEPLKTVPCRACQKFIVFLPTERGSTMPVDADSVTEGDEVYDHKVHVSHFATCPKADKFRKRDKKP